MVLPRPADVGRRAAQIIGMVQGSDEYDRLEASSLKYNADWATFTGYPVISNWSLARDAGPLFVEALRVLALKSAVYELTGGDEHAAELEISLPVDEMTHAVLAQVTLCQKMTRKLGIDFVHMTDEERFAYEPGSYADDCYRAAGWGEPDRRYWVGKKESMRRLSILGDRYESVGIDRRGRNHSIDFEKLEEALAAVS